MFWQSTRWVGILTTALLFTAGVSASAQDDLVEQLNLTADQKTKLKELQENFQKEAGTLQKQINDLVADERRLRKNDAPESELRKVMQERADKEIELTMALNRFTEKVKNLLTAEQLRKWEQLKKQR